MPKRLIALSEVERVMKIQEVILKAMSGELKWYQAAEILGMSDRQMRRWKTRYEEFGYDGLLDRRKGTPSPRCIPYETAVAVLRLYRQEYQGFNVKHFHEELTQVHEIKVSYSWTKSLLQESGLVDKATRRGKYRRRRPRKPMTGMMLHLDGSEHRWFRHCEHERQCLLVVLDDANSEIVAARFVREESTGSCLSVLQQVVEERGTFARLYTDRASHFVYTPKAGQPPDRSHRTQLEQVLDELGTELVIAYSPEARGRSERMFRTLQGRLVPELRRAGVRSYEEANRYLETYLPKHNANFMVQPTETMSAYLPVVGFNIHRVFALRHTRTVRRDNTVHYDNASYQLPRVQGCSTLNGRKVEVREHQSGTIEILLASRVIRVWDVDDDVEEVGRVEAK